MSYNNQHTRPSSNFTRQKSFSRPINPNIPNKHNNNRHANQNPHSNNVSSPAGDSENQSSASKYHKTHNNSNLRNLNSSPVNRRDSFTNAHIVSPTHLSPTEAPGNHRRMSTNPLETISADNELKEIHEKMSKKITQLTKVVYNLNTKNDEYSETMRKLKNNHKLELLAIASEMEAKLAKLKEKATNEIQVKERIKELENQLEHMLKEKVEFETKINHIKTEAESILNEKLKIQQDQYKILNNSVQEKN